MIYILHGEDVNASYKRLTSLKEDFPKHQTINLGPNSSEEDFVMATSVKDLFAIPKITIGENLINQSKITPKSLKLISKETTVILWEHKQLAPRLFKTFSAFCTIENFKPKSDLFYFLDAIRPDPKMVLDLLHKLDFTKETVLMWQITQRILFLILAKLDLDIESVQTIIGRRVEDWQWSKISNQSKLFNLASLKSFYHGSLKLDYLIKTGKTDLNQKTLVSILLLKYLAR